MIHLFPNGMVETFCRGSRFKRGYYRWTPAYSEAKGPAVSIPLTRRHWQDIAHRDGVKCVFHKSKEAANGPHRQQA